MKTFVVSMMMMVLISGNLIAGTKEKADKPGEPAAVNTAISGIIVDQETGEVLTGVEVKLDGADKKTYTDFDGKFVFKDVKPGQHSVEAKFISYQPLKRSLSINTNEVHALNLKLGTVDKE